MAISAPGRPQRREQSRHWDGEVDAELTKITITADSDGAYNVLAIGTRKDKVAKEGFDPLGLEYQKK